ncbi:phosphoribosylanthranilate isomerase [Tundrisphaera lichenicola]|uniref:phosphoribosylanthranilate isomerase n=1 Tax=Tundrisphaera lichenicola TaxID=2029860 RepID=UPI003EBEC76F
MIPTRVKVKVCGLTEVRNALACVAAGADWIGLNFHPPSPRFIGLDRGAEIASALHGKAVAVGLFVDRPIDKLIDLLGDLPGLGVVQLHGDEDVGYLERLARALPLLKVVRAFRLPDPASIDRMADYIREAEARSCAPHAILVDAHVAGRLGGTGHSITPDLLDLLPTHPRLILAGGLTPDNVADRVRRVRPWMVDVASGVESSPGYKDPDQVADFIGAAQDISNNPY